MLQNTCLRIPAPSTKNFTPALSYRRRCSIVLASGLVRTPYLTPTFVYAYEQDSLKTLSTDRNH